MSGDPKISPTCQRLVQWGNSVVDAISCGQPSTHYARRNGGALVAWCEAHTRGHEDEVTPIYGPLTLISAAALHTGDA